MPLTRGYGETLLPHDELSALLPEVVEGDNTVRLWDTKSGVCLDELAHPDSVAAVAFSPDGRRLLVDCDDENLYAYDVLMSTPENRAD
jgi:WD40 repeat protein